MPTGPVVWILNTFWLPFQPENSPKKKVARQLALLTSVNAMHFESPVPITGPTPQWLRRGQPVPRERACCEGKGITWKLPEELIWVGNEPLCWIFSILTSVSTIYFRSFQIISSRDLICATDDLTQNTTTQLTLQQLFLQWTNMNYNYRSETSVWLNCALKATSVTRLQIPVTRLHLSVVSHGGYRSYIMLHWQSIC